MDIDLMVRQIHEFMAFKNKWEPELERQLAERGESVDHKSMMRARQDQRELESGEALAEESGQKSSEVQMPSAAARHQEQPAQPGTNADPSQTKPPETTDSAATKRR